MASAQPHTARDGRAAILCTGCRAVVAYISEAQVKRVATLTGRFGVNPNHLIRDAADMALLRCTRCEESSK